MLSQKKKKVFYWKKCLKESKEIVSASSVEKLKYLGLGVEEPSKEVNTLSSENFWLEWFASSATRS